MSDGIPRLFVKPGVDLNGLDAGGRRILRELSLIPDELGFSVTITCGREGHPADDPHSRGAALDCRTSDLSADEVLALYKRLAMRLGQRFTVLYEVPVSQRALLDPKVVDLVYGPSDPNAQHIHAQVKKGTTYQEGV